MTRPSQRRRTPGTGAVYERRSYPPGTKRWVAQVVLGYDADGKRHDRLTYHHTKTEAARAAAEMVAAFRSGKLRYRAPLTFGAYLATWLRAVRPLLEAKTLAEYERYALQVLTPALGGLQLEKLDRAAARQFFTGLSEAGRSPRYQRAVLAVARKAMNDAIADDLVAVNPFTRIPLAKLKRQHLTVWTPEQVREFLDAVKSDDDRMLFLIAILTGARAGELFALQPEDVGPATVRIGRSVTRVAKVGFVLKSPKSDDGWRTLALHPLAVLAFRRQAELVEARRTLAGPTWQEHGLVFPNTTGGYREPHTPRVKLARVAGRIGLPVLTFHGLRHLHAALLILVGSHAKAIQEQLGHSSIDVTLDTYGHLMPGLGAAGAMAVGDLFDSGEHFQ